MKLIRVVSGATLLVFLTAGAPAFAAQERQGDRQDKARQQDKQRAKPDKQGEADKQKAKPRGEQRGAPPAQAERGQPPAARQRPQAERRPPANERKQPPLQSPERRPQRPPAPPQAAPRPQRAYPQQMRSEQQARAWQQQRGWQRQDVWREHATWRQHQARRWDVDHRSWVQRGGYGGYYIPERHFSLYFGAQHYFRIRTRPIIVAGYPRFQYRGFWFMLVDPWPEFWASNWYATDDVYIDYDDGYYLYNRRHPGVAIAVAVVF